MAEETVYMRTMRRAIENLGGPPQLAKALATSVAEIEAWAGGFAVPPHGIFLKLIDLLSHHGWNPGGPGGR